MIVLKLYCSASPGERGGKPPQQVHSDVMLMRKMGVLEMENKFEINCFLLFSVSCKTESGEAGHRGHRRIFPLLVRRSFIFYLFSFLSFLSFLSFIFFLFIFYLFSF